MASPFSFFIFFFFLAFAVLSIGLSTDECDDDNACTFDWLDVEKGCQHDEITCGPCHAHQTTPTTDFIFLLDISHPINETRLDLLYKSLSTFREMISDDSSHGSYRFLTAGFSTTNEMPTVLQHFTRSVTFLQHDNLFYQQDSNFENPNDVSTETRLLTALGALNQTISNGTFVIHRESTNSDEKQMEISSLTEERLAFREAADIHIVMVTDLQYSSATENFLSDDFNKRSLRVINDIIDSLQTRPISISIVFDTTNQAAKLLWGDPLLANVYIDLRGFNRAFTLKALIAAGESQASTLQAHALSHGVEFQTFDINQMNNTEWIRHMYSGYIQSSRVRPEFCNECKRMVRPCNHTLGCQIETVDCPDKHYCSPTHGCVPKPKKSDREGNRFLTNSDADEFVNTSHDTDVNHSWIETRIVNGHVPVWEWHPDRPFTHQLISMGKPVVIRNALPHKWAAKEKWNMTYLSGKLGEILTDVKHTNDEMLTYDPDRRVPMATFPTVDFRLPYTVRNTTNDEFFRSIRNESETIYGGCYYFTDMPDELKPDVDPHEPLFVTHEDVERFKQFLWVSSSGMITHTHFDQDYNFFVQIYGEKEFTLWLPSEHAQMHVFPRVHPMWHKSRVNLRRPDLDQFPHFAKSRAYKARLHPGDLLYVPPYTWHHVVSTTPSISLSTYSHDYSVYDHMNAVYRHDHKFDLLANKTGQMYALRLYLDLMIHELVGNHQTTPYFVDLLDTRYTGLHRLFPVSRRDKQICRSRVVNKIPTAQHVLGYAKLDMAMMAPHFAAFRPEVRDILFADYVEEISAQVVGVDKLLAFFRFCFTGQGYYVTDVDDDEHSLWDHKDDSPT
ncbi:uncharacterized protein LOC134181477 [Corticium candelabrum]|uniref:uncharacterized protein LOC134181477 n=1 Tax=Corticium candelabrum TaxID=121492 RepID=UPI002E263D0D|nr:uncharacterized protein LOC134181477 [Corticium candelabrum]